MFSCCRRIPHFISTNARTFFCETTKRSPLTSDAIRKILDKCKGGKTEISGHKYQMLRVHNNLQLLNVINPTLEDKKIGCCIVVNAGFDDSTEKYFGLPHLLEHVICSMGYYTGGCASENYTERFCTVYSVTIRKRYDEILKTWIENLFSESDLRHDRINDIVRDELAILDNEFHEKRFSDVVHGASCQILKSLKIGLHFPQFGSGNSRTMGLEVEDLLGKLNEFRKLYRQRSVAICIYSAHKLEMKDIVKSLNVGDFLSEKPPMLRKKRRLEEDMEEYPMGEHPIVITKKPVIAARNKYGKKYLIVARSEDDRSKLVLMFPFMNKLNVQETTTFKWIAKMIKWKTNGLLESKFVGNE